MLNEVDLNSDGVICFSEFLAMFSKLKTKDAKLFTSVVASKAGDMNQNVDDSGFTHSYLVEEKEVFARALNHHLEGDADVAQYLPVRIDNDDFFFVLADGIILCKLINLIQENTIDMRAVNMK
jgi:Calponin homology (CH) domain